MAAALPPARPLPRCPTCGGSVLRWPTPDRFAGVDFELACLLCGRDPDHQARVEYPLVDAIAPETAAALAAWLAERPGAAVA